MKILCMAQEQYIWASDLLVEALCEGNQLNAPCLLYFRKFAGLWHVSAGPMDGAVAEPVFLSADFDAFAANVCIKVLQLIRRERGTEHTAVYDELDYFQEIYYSEEYQQVEAKIDFNFHEFLTSYQELQKVSL